MQVTTQIRSGIRNSLVSFGSTASFASHHDSPEFFYTNQDSNLSIVWKGFTLLRNETGWSTY